MNFCTDTAIDADFILIKEALPFSKQKLKQAL